MVELASSTVWTDNTAEMNKNSLLCHLGSYHPDNKDWFSESQHVVLEAKVQNTRKVETVVKPITVASSLLSSSSGSKKRRTSTRSSQSSKDNKATTSNKKGKSKQEPPQQQQSQEAQDSLTTKGFKRHYAEHDYHDYAQVKPTQLDLRSIKATRGGVHNPFPSVLHNMMEQADPQGFSNIISWQPHGRAFLIHNPKEFVQNVLPMFFKHSKLSSFQRQLSLYGFIRLSHDGPDRGAYYHQCFLRGRSFLCSNIQRTRVKGTWVRTSSSPEAEPDFYKMEVVKSAAQEQEPTRGGQTNKIMPPWLTPCNNHNNGGGASPRTVQRVVEDACTLLEADTEPTPVSSLKRPRVAFWDTRSLESTSTSSCLKGDRMIQLNRPPHADAGLQPPPAFPSDIVGSSEMWGMTGGKTFFPPEDCSKEDPSFSENLFSSEETQQSLSQHLPFSFPSTIAPIRDDDELAMFLTEIDLETEMDSEFDGLVKTARV